MADNDLQYSINEAFDELNDRDSTTEIVGYIDEISSAKEVGQVVKYKLLKFVLNNNSSKRITCLIWGDELIHKYSSELKIHRIVHVDGELTKATQTNYRKEAMNLVPFELIIQKHTVLDFLGYHSATNSVAETEATDVDFDTIRDVDGIIRIDGFVITKWVSSINRYDNSTVGCGAITNGTHKITVNILQFDNLDIEKGTAVRVTGQVENKDGFLSISCKDITCIEVVKDIDPMPTNLLMKGVRTP